MAAEALRARASRAEAVAGSLERAIASGTVAAGERLGTKEELRRRYNVAAGTLNEAVRLLQNRGWIELRPGPGGGLFATVPSPAARLSELVGSFEEAGATVADCLVVRDALEPLIAAEAARHATADDVAALRTLVERMTQSLGDPPAYLEADWELHRRMAAISPNAVLSSAYLTVLGFARERVRAEAFAGGSRTDLRVHEALVGAIAAGDEKATERAARRHAPPALT
jgi:GntR family transcriptional regulator, transcriptional repressor for pyruvate dehydrogenase complex